MPTVEHVGVSRKIMEDEERRRLKTLLKEVRQERGGGGFIARTAGAGRSAEDFQRDGRYLGRAWDEVRARGGRERAPVLLHRELGLVQRLLRDLLSDDIANPPRQRARVPAHARLVGELQPERPRVRHTQSSSIQRSTAWRRAGGALRRSVARLGGY